MAFFMGAMSNIPVVKMRTRKIQRKGFRDISMSLPRDHELMLDMDLPVLAGHIEDKNVDKWFRFYDRRKNKVMFVHFFRGKAWLHERPTK